jgi:hypothetical protein
MPKQLDEITLSSTGGKPKIEIIFGQAHVGNYRFFLWDASGKNPIELSHGNNVDDAVDSFDIGEALSALDRRILSFELIVQAAEARQGQIYSVTITVRQDGTVCAGGLISESGALEDVKSLIGFRRFKTI